MTSLRGKMVMEAALFAIYDTIADHRGRAPNSGAHQMLPNQFAFVRGEKIHMAVVRSHVETIIENNRTTPKAVLLFCSLIQSAFGFISPNKFAIVLSIAANDSIFRGGINKAIDDRWGRV